MEDKVKKNSLNDFIIAWIYGLLTLAFFLMSPIMYALGNPGVGVVMIIFGFISSMLFLITWEGYS